LSPLGRPQGDFVLARYNGDGMLDCSFGAGAVLVGVANFNGNTEFALAHCQ
jgi:hypothetical protein